MTPTTTFETNQTSPVQMPSSAVDQEISAPHPHAMLMLTAMKSHDGGINVVNLAAVSSSLNQLSEQQSAHPDWFFELELTDVDTAERSELAQLLASAPSDYLAGFIYSKILARMELAQMTQRGWWNEELDAKTDHAYKLAVARVQDKLAELQTSDSDWFAAYEQVDPVWCSLDELRGLLKDAPAGIARGVCFGALSFRLHQSWAANFRSKTN